VSPRGRRRGAPQPLSTGPAQLGWALLVIAAALIGGLAAATLVHASVVVAVIVSVVVGGVALLAVFRSPARPELGAGDRPGAEFGGYEATRRGPAPPLLPAQTGTHSVPPAQTGPRTVPPAAFAPGDPDPVAPSSAVPRRPGPDGQARADALGGNENVVQLLPLQAQPGQPGPPDAPWWDSPQGAPPPSPGARRAPAPDLSTYLASTFIAQCPRCGAFRLDIHPGRPGWDFRCESCAYTWTWQPGTPWPPVRVMPGGRPPSP
jgi:hypothetical protein